MTPRGQIPESFIQDLLGRVDIVDIVGRHVQLKKGGANLLGLCPFHGEKSPSFTVSPAKQFYHCFGCGAHGDAIRFLMDHAGMGFVDAVRDLAQQVGVKVPEADVDPAEQARAQAERARQGSVIGVLEQAAAHYRDRLKSDERAVAYLRKRGLSGEIARDFGLGFAPDGWRNLASAFPRYDDPLLAEAGLVIVQGDDGPEQKRYDRFRDRIMFPIRSVKGEVIGFGGRVLDAGEPKYLNSPETPVFVKGRELYGLYEARQAIRQRGHALVVEGYMDVVALAQNGIGNAVATLGTACTADHVKKLLRFTDHVVFSFDGDAAGRRAAGRALEAALPHAGDLRSFRFLFLPPEHDPDSYVRELGQAAFEDQIAAAVPLSQQLLDQAADGCDLDAAEGRARLLAQARPLWTQLPDGAFRGQVLSDLAARARMTRDELERLWNLAGTAPTRPGPSENRPAGSRPQRSSSRLARAGLAVRLPQDHVARALLQDAELWHQLAANEHDLLTRLPTWHAQLFAWLERELHDQGPAAWPSLREQLAGQSFEQSAIDLVDGADVLAPPTLDELRLAVDQVRQAQQRMPHLAVLGRG